MTFYNENDPKPAAWIRELIAAGEVTSGTIDQRSIHELRSTDLVGFTRCHFFAGIAGWDYALRLAGWPIDRPVWTGSCPCQPFSDAGTLGGFSDDRHLWPAWFDLIKECGPATLFGEQVASEAALAWLDVVFTDLEGAGYTCGASDLCAAGVGATQRRQRLFWMANADHTRWEGPERNGQPDKAREERTPARCESLRSIGGHWPPGPSEVGRIPVLVNGLPGSMGRCRGYGNAIVPQVAAQFIQAATEAMNFK